MFSDDASDALFDFGEHGFGLVGAVASDAKLETVFFAVEGAFVEGKVGAVNVQAGHGIDRMIFVDHHVVPEEVTHHVDLHFRQEVLRLEALCDRAFARIV